MADLRLESFLIYTANSCSSELTFTPLFELIYCLTSDKSSMFTLCKNYKSIHYILANSVISTAWAFADFWVSLCSKNSLSTYSLVCKSYSKSLMDSNSLTEMFSMIWSSTILRCSAVIKMLEQSKNWLNDKMLKNSDTTTLQMQSKINGTM